MAEDEPVEEQPEEEAPPPEPVQLPAQPEAPEEYVTISMQFSTYTPTDQVAAQAVSAYLLAGGGQVRPGPPEGRAVGDPEPLEGERERTVPVLQVAAVAPTVEPFSTEQPESDLGPVPRVGYPGIRVEEEPPPREAPPEPPPPAQPEGP